MDRRCGIRSYPGDRTGMNPTIEWEVLLEDTEDIELHIESLVQGTLKTEVIPLGRLPKRGEYSMRLQIETIFRMKNM